MSSTAASAPPPIRTITRDDVAALAAGCAVFGTGGGGSVHGVQQSVEIAIEANGPVRVIGVNELGPDDAVIIMSGMGAPGVGIEMLGSSSQAHTLLTEVERLVGRKITTVMAAEIGGSNGVAPVGWASTLGLNVLDADGMGRAFPEATMISMNVAGIPNEFAVMSDVVGNVTVLRTIDIAWLERHARAFTVAAGGIALGAHYLLTHETAPGAVIENTVSRAVQVGRRLLSSADPVTDIADELGAIALLRGKVIDIDRNTAGGFTRGSVTIDGISADRDRMIRVEIQNENLVVIEDGEIIVSVPDLVTILDTETGEAISTEMLRFGQRVSVIAWACDPLWRTPRGIELAGPKAFGYDFDYDPFDGAAGTPSTTETAEVAR